MALEDILPQVETRMRKAIEALKHELASVRTGRAAPSLVEELSLQVRDSYPLHRCGSSGDCAGFTRTVKATDRRCRGQCEETCLQPIPKASNGMPACWSVRAGT